MDDKNSSLAALAKTLTGIQQSIPAELNADFAYAHSLVYSLGDASRYGDFVSASGKDFLAFLIDWKDWAENFNGSDDDPMLGDFLEKDFNGIPFYDLPIDHWAVQRHRYSAGQGLCASFAHYVIGQSFVGATAWQTHGRFLNGVTPAALGTLAEFVCFMHRVQEMALKFIKPIFHAQGLDQWYPFGEAAYSRSCVMKDHHQDPKRRLWVNSMIEAMTAVKEAK